MKLSRNVLTRTGALLGVSIVVTLLVHYCLSFGVNKYIGELKAKGEPMGLAEALPPPVSQEQNGAPHIADTLTNALIESVATNYLPTSLCMVAPAKAMVIWREPEIRTLYGTNNWEQLKTALVAAQSSLASLRCLTNYSTLDFGWNYGRPRTIPSWPLFGLRDAAVSLYASELSNLREKKTSDALADLHTMLAIVKEQRNERFDLSQCIRMGIADLNASATWEFLQDPSISKSELALLQNDWKSCEFADSATRACLMDRIDSIDSMEHFRQKPADLWNYVMNDEATGTICRYYWQWFGSYADEKRALEIYGVWIDALRLAETNHSFQTAQLSARTNFEQLGLKIHLPEGMRIDIEAFEVDSLFSENAEKSFQLLRKAMASETTKNMVITAIALKRNQLVHHEFPVALDDLKDSFLKTIPTDYMNGQLLHYQRNADGTFTLYSVGEDGVDDGGGDPTTGKSCLGWQDHNARDWVWPQPATPAEVEYYYKHPPK